ncbi:receptor-type tyrosine-protein phosphatase S-like [Engraulis encrasicolus]|uniref:receptor-type tyrosine-protein phosphatase S-like n=1 Tax=Engraulis encrasicolus TaxID=184585 RepID=UPI002FCFDE82
MNKVMTPWTVGGLSAPAKLTSRPGRSPLILLLLLTVLLLPLPSLSVASDPPRFIQIPKDQIVVSGGTASLVCQATGEPRPQVEWRKKGKTINSRRIDVRHVVHIVIG